MNSGIVSLTIDDDFGEVENGDHGLITGSVAREVWHIHPDDPLSARGETHWSETVRRGQWSTRTETYANMWCDKTHFHLSARLEAYEGDALIYEREVSDSILRV